MRSEYTERKLLLGGVFLVSSGTHCPFSDLKTSPFFILYFPYFFFSLLFIFCLFLFLVSFFFLFDYFWPRVHNLFFLRCLSFSYSISFLLVRRSKLSLDHDACYYICIHVYIVKSSSLR